MYKNFITISLPNNTTQDEIKTIRKEYREKGYIVNIVISGNKDAADVIKEFIKAKFV